MNVAPKREGFVDGRPTPKVIDAEPLPQSEAKPSRAMPPPEVEPSPAEQPPMWQDEWPLKVKLINKPIHNNKGEKITELVLREPRAGDINRYGNPVRINQDGDVVWDERKMTYMIAALSDILAPFIEDMHPRDWNTVAMKLRNFFSARSTGLVGDEDEIILDCYRLARWYHVSPEVFLSMPFSDVRIHLERTATLDRRQQPPKDDD